MSKCVVEFLQPTPLKILAEFKFMGGYYYLFMKLSVDFRFGRNDLSIITISKKHSEKFTKIHHHSRLFIKWLTSYYLVISRTSFLVFLWFQSLLKPKHDKLLELLVE